MHGVLSTVIHLYISLIIHYISCTVGTRLWCTNKETAILLFRLNTEQQWHIQWKVVQFRLCSQSDWRKFSFVLPHGNASAMYGCCHIAHRINIDKNKRQWIYFIHKYRICCSVKVNCKFFHGVLYGFILYVLTSTYQGLKVLRYSLFPLLWM